MIYASLLSANQLKLSDEINKLLGYGIRHFHIDIMDGHFVDNLAFGIKTICDIKNTYDIYMDCHIMAYEPLNIVNNLIDIKVNSISIHYESTNLETLLIILKKIKDNNIKCGIAIKPKTNINCIEPIINYIDYILIMTVEPGFGGQEFIGGMVDKIISASKYKLEIMVDGGINNTNIDMLHDKGVTNFVIGSYLFKNGVSMIEKYIYDSGASYY